MADLHNSLQPNTSTGRVRRHRQSSQCVSLLRALAILETFSELGPELTLSEIGARLHLNVGTVHRLLHTLIQAGYVKPGSNSAKYRLGLRPISLAKVCLNTLPVRTEAVPFLRTLAEQTGANANLGVLDGMEVVYVERAPSPQVADVYFHGGRRAPAHCTALGKALLAFSPPETLAGLLPDNLARLTDRTITDKTALHEPGPVGSAGTP